MIRGVARKGGDEENGVMLIRAVQGHSNPTVEASHLMQTLTVESDLPQFCVHGTFYNVLDSIVKNGLQSMGRHIHFTSTDAHIRRDAEVAICLNLYGAIQSGIPFYRAKNGVIVSPGPVGPEFFLQIKDRRTFEKVTFEEVPRARSRSPRRLVHHKSLHKGVFGTLPENTEYVSWVIVLKALGKMLETKVMLRKR
jgi:hypothetical protein